MQKVKCSVHSVCHHRLLDVQCMTIAVLICIRLDKAIMQMIYFTNLLHFFLAAWHFVVTVLTPSPAIKVQAG